MGPVTVSSINDEIKEIEDCIVEYQNAIKNKKLELAEKKKLMKKLEKYQETPIEKRTLIGLFSRYRPTVSMMDDFERLTELGFRRYERLIIELGYEKLYIKESLSLIVEHYDNYSVVGDTEFTMTELKNKKCKRQFFLIKKQIDEMSENEEIEFGKIYTLDNPMFLKAQNSMNRSGYGTYYNNRGELVQQGTLYGETTYYLVTGFILGPLIYTDFYKN